MQHMWSDNETSTDLLGYRHLVGAILSIVREDSLLPATIGVFGDWGSGKSSLIRMARTEIEKDTGTLVLVFNGWLFEGYEDAKSALMGSILDELAVHKTLSTRGKELVARLVRRIDFMRVTGSLARAAAGYAAADIPGLAAGVTPDLAVIGANLLDKAKAVSTDDVEKYLREDQSTNLRRSIRDFRKDFAGLLNETSVKRLVIIIDDLDRCDPDAIIETLEAIKLFLFVPKTTFIIGADERLIRYAVRRRFPELPGERAEVGRDYLEKLIQFPIRIPPMGRAETETYIKLLLAVHCELTKEAYESLRAAAVVSDSRLDSSLDRMTVVAALGSEPPKALDEALALAERISPVLAAGLLGNPRQCKRFLNTLVMRLTMANSRGIELGRRILAKLMLLEYLRPESFKELAKLQASEGGRPKEIVEAEKELNRAKHGDADDISNDLGEESPVIKRRAAPKPNESKPEQVITDAALISGGLGWRTDTWLSEWLASEPKLTGADLRPYFYFARERLDSLVEFTMRMSPAAQDALTKLLGPLEAERTTVLTRASQFSAADSAAIFEALCGSVRECETPSAVNSPLSCVFDWIDARPELFGEFVTFLKTLPHTNVPFAIVPRLARFGSTAERKRQIGTLLNSWKNSGNQNLNRAVASQFSKLKA